MEALQFDFIYTFLVNIFMFASLLDKRGFAFYSKVQSGTTRGAKHFRIKVYFIFFVVIIILGCFCYTQILYIVSFSKQSSTF